MSFRPARYPCRDVTPHPEHQHTEGPDDYFYLCPGLPLPEDAPEDAPEAKIERVARVLCELHGAGAWDELAPEVRDALLHEAAARLRNVRALSSPDHYLRLEFDAEHEAIGLGFVCNAAPDADCHLICAEGCESCDHPRTRQVSYCNPGEFINNADLVIQSAQRQQPFVYLPVDLAWTGETYNWVVAPDALPQDPS